MRFLPDNRGASKISLRLSRLGENIPPSQQPAQTKPHHTIYESCDLVAGSIAGGAGEN